MSISSWWRWFRGVALELEASGHLERVDDGDAGERWAAVGVDPRFIASHDQGRRFPAGWYRLRMDLRRFEGFIDNPCFYPDYGQGMGDAHRVRIPYSSKASTSQVDAVVRFTHEVHCLRMDPSTAPCEFELTNATLVRMGTVRATLVMLRRLVQRFAGDRDMLGIAAGEAWKAWREGGLPGFGEWLYAFHDEMSEGVSLDYQAWLRRFDTPVAYDLRQMEARIARFARRPLVSIVMPVYNTPEQWLRLCLDSVLAQTYPHWELCIADDASPDPRVGEVLAEYAARDARIKVVRREANGHISAASNSALEIATGDYVALLDHDDELAPHALYMVAKALDEQPGLRLVYSDEDKVDEQGNRFAPYFKPDWNPELLLSQNYVCHLSVYEAALLRGIGGFRIGFEGSQDHDLALRATARLSSDEIGHIPHILYHWRAIASSTALSGTAKSYTDAAGVRAITEYLHARGDIEATVEPVTGGYRVRRPVGDDGPLVSLVIPTRDRVELLRMSVGTILERTHYRNFEIVIVDNQSTDADALAYMDEVQRDPRVRVIRHDAPFNYSRINNVAVRACRGTVIGLVNNDIEVIDGGWLEEMLGLALVPQYGAVGAMLYYPDDRIQHAGVIVGIGGVAGHAHVGQPRGTPGQHNRAMLAQNLSAVTAACLLVRREVFEEVGGLDEDFEVAFNDVDFCLRVAARGYLNVWTPWAELYHHESASRGYEDNPVKMARFMGEVGRIQARWGSSLAWDPAYNPNLSLLDGNFDLAIPPRLYLKDSMRDGRAVLSICPFAEHAKATP
ncbi:glycosyltransferase family 2 protein [Luteimonas arsenica]|uniref:glycosyltransferase family 2 protein n=1 Tax=Luteimonas arsenica TaxID=1586242 RepID=UPI0010569915|nr:glycosyltransferase family 2 protein [Luteimonas arsenica]